MKTKTLGILHPGEMGVSVAATARSSGCKVLWASEDRSEATSQRAQQHGLNDAGSIAELSRKCSVIVSVCPPNVAENVAASVAANSFTGLFIDANAISPERAVRIGGIVENARIDFVDGGIVGGPAWNPKKTWLYLSGKRAAEAATFFAAGPLETEVIGREAGQASALKMCFAANTKGTSALLSAILAVADTHGLRDTIFDVWERHLPETAERARKVPASNSAKAWRFVGEMEEIASTFRAAEMPEGFHAAAAQIYQRLAPFKDWPEPPTLDQFLAALKENAP